MWLLSRGWKFAEGEEEEDEEKDEEEGEKEDWRRKINK